MSNLYTVVDIETTGFSSAFMAEIIEVAAYRTDGTEILDSFHSYIKPWKPIPKKITDITHITNDMVADSPNKWNVLPQLRKFIGDSTFVAHNATFDFNFLNIEFFGMDLPIMDRYICTMTNYKASHPKTKATLSECIKTYGITLDNAHSAKYDALATAELFIKMLAENNIHTTIFSKKENTINTLSRIVSGRAHTQQSKIMLDVPSSNSDTIITTNEIKEMFMSGKTPNDICAIYKNDYQSVSKLFSYWLNGIRVAKFLPLINDKKISREMNAIASISDTYDEFINNIKTIYLSDSINLSVCGIYWATIKGRENMKYSNKDFTWQFDHRKSVIDISREFKVNSFIVADAFVEYAIANKEKCREYIQKHLCLRSELTSILKGEEFVNTLAPYPSDKDIRKYISQKLYERNFFTIKLI